MAESTEQATPPMKGIELIRQVFGDLPQKRCHYLSAIDLEHDDLSVLIKQACKELREASMDNRVGAITVLFLYDDVEVTP